MDTGNRSKEQRNSNPWMKANFFSQLFFWWVTPIIKLGNRRTLRVNDLYSTIPDDKSEVLGLALEREWLKQVENCSNSKKERPSFSRVLLGMFGINCVIPGLQILLEECVVKVGQPLLLSHLIKFFVENSNISVKYAYLYASGVVLCSVFNMFNNHLMGFTCSRIGMRARVATCSFLFKKSLRLSQKSLCETNIGQIINLISNDASRFDLLFAYLHYLWISPLQIGLTTVVLYYNDVGVASVMGFAAMIFLIPVQQQIGRAFSRLRKETAERTDLRIQIINEVIPVMRVIKMYAWEKYFLNLIQLSRKVEMKYFRRTSYLRAFNVTLFYVSSKLMIFPTLVVFVLLENELTPDKVFLIVALFNNIRSSMPGYFCTAIQTVAETKVSIRRIEDYLLLDEMTTNNDTPVQVTNSKVRKIELNHVTSKWPVSPTIETQQNNLENVSFTAHPEQLIFVVGQVGSGKSTLLNLILGELPTLKGRSVVEGRIAYCSQEPWIITGTIRQNILCGTQMDLERYHEVIKATALEQDLDKLPQGDHSIIGESGISLSGGQKARVNLARCLYVDADIYLLDDPLSAVDTHVGAHLVQRAIKTFLRKKICILVTHQLQHIRLVDHIILLKSGRVEFNGIYSEFTNLGLDLNDMVTEMEDVEDLEDDAFYDDSNPRQLMSLPSINEQEELSNEKISKSIRRKSIQKHARRANRHRTRSSSSFNSTRMKSMHESKRIKERRSLMPITSQEVQEETSTTTGVALSTYWKYFKSGSGVLLLSLFVVNCLATEFLFCVSDYWLKLWTSTKKDTNNSSESFTILKSTNSSEEQQKIPRWFGDDWIIDTTVSIYVYAILISCVIVLSYLRAIHFYDITLKASTKLHQDMTLAIFGAPIQFFDQNPVGTIVNRFSRDTGCMDDTFPPVLFDPIWIGLNTIGAMITVAFVEYWLLVPAVILGIGFSQIRKNYLKASCGIKRLEASTRSPIFTQLYSSLIGLTTLRAHNCQNYFQKDFDHYQDVHSSAWFLFFSSARWLSVWMDVIIVIYTASVTYACVALRESMGSSEAGLIISAAMSMTRFQYGIRQSAEMVNQMTSVDRVIEFGKIPPEAPLESNNDSKPPPNWPDSGKIKFEDMSLRYSPTDEPVLKNINCVIKSQEKIGIVGRSGAGKSTIIAALFRLTEPDGRILIDGIDIKTIGLRDLRSKISIIPQEPVLFSGSLRTNLDPFGKASDSALWSAIKDVHLDSFMMAPNESTSESILDFEISEGGTNLSVGERQLVCLARAILQDNRILVLDEATASVDQETDAFIQLIIREIFENCTVLTIAHRLNTIIDSDKIMVLDFGKLSEFDEPIQLLSNPFGIFHSLVEQTGPEAAVKLVDLAKKTSAKKKSG